MKRSQGPSQDAHLQAKNRKLVHLAAAHVLTALSGAKKRTSERLSFDECGRPCKRFSSSHLKEKAFDEVVYATQVAYKSAKDSQKPAVLSLILSETDDGKPIFSRMEMEEQYGWKISKKSFRNARKHRQKYGPGVPAPAPIPPALNLLSSEAIAAMAIFWEQNSQESSKVIKKRQTKKQKLNNEPQKV